MLKRIKKIIFNKSRNSITGKLIIPKEYLEIMKITEEDREVELELTANKEIIIRKKGE